MSIKKIIKTLIDLVWKIQVTLVSIGRMLVYSKWVQLPLLSTTKEQRIFVLVNGPSLNETLEFGVEELKQEEVICVNHMVQSPYFIQLRPRYYVMIYDGFFSVKDHSVKENMELKTLWKLQQQTTWEMYLIVPTKAKTARIFQDIISKNKNIKICYINCIEFNGFAWVQNFFRDKQLVSFACYNVLSASIFSAIVLGYQTIYILGADHNYHRDLRVDQDNHVIRSDPHFYDIQHDDKILRWADGRAVTMYEQMQGLADTLREYAKIEAYARKRNVIINNLTPNSSIDVFKKRLLSDVLTKKQSS